MAKLFASETLQTVTRNGMQILGGHKEKMRPGDVLGALTKDMGFSGTQIGKISVTDMSTYVAVERAIADQALAKLNAGLVKGKLSDPSVDS